MTRPDQRNEASRSIAEPVRYGNYEAVIALIDGQVIIRRQDGDHKRTVCFVETLAEWDRFVAALKSGADEVAAVHAIDHAGAGIGRARS